MYVFGRNRWGADVWGEVEKIAAADVGAWIDFGSAVSIDGEKVVVGCAVEEDITGSAYVFERNQGGPDGWGFVEKITAGDDAGADHFGYSVAIVDHAVAVGAPHDDEGGDDSGSAYFFRLTESLTPLFADGFESGDTIKWSRSVP